MRRLGQQRFVPRENGDASDVVKQMFLRGVGVFLIENSTPLTLTCLPPRTFVFDRIQMLVGLGYEQRRCLGSAGSLYGPRSALFHSRSSRTFAGPHGAECPRYQRGSAGHSSRAKARGAHGAECPRYQHGSPSFSEKRPKRLARTRGRNCPMAAASLGVHDLRIPDGHLTRACHVSTASLPRSVLRRLSSEHLIFQGCWTSGPCLASKMHEGAVLVA
jgi:hypothetical protein